MDLRCKTKSQVEFRWSSGLKDIFLHYATQVMMALIIKIIMWQS